MPYVRLTMPWDLIGNYDATRYFMRGAIRFAYCDSMLFIKTMVLQELIGKYNFGGS